MTKAILKFTLPDDDAEFQLALSAGKMHSALWNVGQEVFRPARKHGYPNERTQHLLDKINALVKVYGGLDPNWPKDECGLLDAADLIAILEKMFYEILDIEGVSL